MTLEILDPDDFLADGILRQDDFLERAHRYDWDRFRGKKVLVRGCSSGIIPPWVYMIITANVSPIARSVRFGNEHDNIVISRSGSEA